MGKSNLLNWQDDGGWVGLEVGGGAEWQGTEN